MSVVATYAQALFFSPKSHAFDTATGSQVCAAAVVAFNKSQCTFDGVSELQTFSLIFIDGNARQHTSALASGCQLSPVVTSAWGSATADPPCLSQPLWGKLPSLNLTCLKKNGRSETVDIDVDVSIDVDVDVRIDKFGD